MCEAAVITILQINIITILQIRMSQVKVINIFSLRIEFILSLRIRVLSLRIKSILTYRSRSVLRYPNAVILLFFPVLEATVRGHLPCINSSGLHHKKDKSVNCKAISTTRIVTTRTKARIDVKVTSVFRHFRQHVRLCRGGSEVIRRDEVVLVMPNAQAGWPNSVRKGEFHHPNPLS